MAKNLTYSYRQVHFISLYSFALGMACCDYIHFKKERERQKSMGVHPAAAGKSKKVKLDVARLKAAREQGWKEAKEFYTSVGVIFPVEM